MKPLQTLDQVMLWVARAFSLILLLLAWTASVAILVPPGLPLPGGRYTSTVTYLVPWWRDPSRLTQEDMMLMALSAIAAIAIWFLGHVGFRVLFVLATLSLLAFFALYSSPPHYVPYLPLAGLVAFFWTACTYGSWKTSRSDHQSQL
jgi:hypothetical protein